MQSMKPSLTPNPIPLISSRLHEDIRRLQILRKNIGRLHPRQPFEGPNCKIAHDGSTQWLLLSLMYPEYALKTEWLDTCAKLQRIVSEVVALRLEVIERTGECLAYESFLTGLKLRVREQGHYLNQQPFALLPNSQISAPLEVQIIQKTQSLRVQSLIRIFLCVHDNITFSFKFPSREGDHNCQNRE